MSVELYHPGLRGVVVGETEISRLEGGLQYRGYCIYDLAEQATFCEVLHLLLYDELPSPDGLADFRSILTEEAELPAAGASCCSSSCRCTASRWTQCVPGSACWRTSIRSRTMISIRRRRGRPSG